MLLSYPGAEREAVHVRKHDVQDGKVQSLSPDTIQRVAPVVELPDLKALVLEI